MTGRVLVLIWWPTKMEPTESSETSAFSTRTPGRYPKENTLLILHLSTIYVFTVYGCVQKDLSISVDRGKLAHLPRHWITLNFITRVSFVLTCTLVVNLAKPDKRVSYKQHFVIGCTCGRKYE